MRNRRIIALAFATIFLLSSSSYAANVQDLINKRNGMEQQKNAVENKIKNIENKQESIEKQIEKIDDDIANVQTSLNEVNGRLVENEAKIEDLNKEMEQLDKQAEEQKKILITRLKAYNENDNTSYLDVLLSSENITDFITRVDIIKQVVSYDKKIIDEAQAIQKELQTKKADLESSKKIIVQSKQEMESIKQKHLAAKAKKDALMGQLTEEQRRFEKEYEDLEEASNQILRDIQRAQSKTKDSPYTGGKMGWPVNGYYTMTSPYGYRIHPVLGGRRLHSGIDVGAPSGAEMVAAADGVVIMSQPYGSYGNTVVINHGGGITTLYAHNSVLIATNGQSVKRGQVISKVGSTGRSTGPHAHFEVRVNGTPTDPLPYLK